MVVLIALVLEVASVSGGGRSGSSGCSSSFDRDNSSGGLSGWVPVISDAAARRPALCPATRVHVCEREDEKLERCERVTATVRERQKMRQSVGDNTIGI